MSRRIGFGDRADGGGGAVRRRRRGGLVSFLVASVLVALVAVGLLAAVFADGVAPGARSDIDVWLEEARGAVERFFAEDGAFAFLAMVAIILFVFFGARRRRSADARPSASPRPTTPARRKNPWADARSPRRNRM